MVLFSRSGLLSSKNLIFLRPKSHGRNKNILHIKFNSTHTEEHVTEVQLSDGKKISFSTGKYARLTSGCVTAKFGDTSVMTTVVRNNANTNQHMLPLTVNYRQKAAAIGRIPTNFLRRELGNTETEILTSRLIDRSLRPLFMNGYSYETQVVCNLLAVDGINDPDVLCINAASAALSVSDIPWNGPVAAVRLGIIDDEYVINPSRRELQHSSLNLVVSSVAKNLIVMIEGAANDILEQDLKKAIRLAVKECQIIVQSITELQKHFGKPKITVPTTEIDDNIVQYVKEFSKKKLQDIFTYYKHDKLSRDDAITAHKKELVESLNTSDSTVVDSNLLAFNQLAKEVFRSLVFKNNKRCDGRTLTDLRDIKCQVAMFDPLHGSAIFQRGQTQVFCTVTLDCIESSLRMDTISMLTSGVKEKNFFLHYEFPPYATNETGKVSGIGRREIGHGALAEKGLRPVIPKNYPFTIRLTSEVLESNGSSSMASVCGGSLALMDAGVPISSPVAGVAIGLITKYSKSDPKSLTDYKILTDILGIEDYLGDMDFKLAGTKRGFTAFQADVKVPGIPLKVIMESILSGTKAKNEIIGIMNSVISSPRIDKNDNKPVLETIEVPIHQRGKFLGVGGLNLKKIFIETGVHIYSQDETSYCIFAPNQTAMNEVKEIIQQILSKGAEPTLVFGDIYTAKIVEIREYGVMLTLHPNMVPALLPNSQLDQRKVHHASALGLQVGQEIQVKYFGRDPANGQIRLSRKVLQDPISQVRNFSSVEEKEA